MPEAEFVVFEPVDCQMSNWFAALSNVNIRTTPLESTRRWQRYLVGLWYWRKVFARERFDVFEALHLPATRPSTGKMLLTIHDVRGIYPGNGWLERLLFRRALRTSLKRADRVATVSQTMRAEILAFANMTPVSVVHNGLDSSSFIASDPEHCQDGPLMASLPDRYLLAVGHFEPRKNYATLVAALDLLHRDGMSLPLVIVGNDSGERLRIEAQIASAGLESGVRLLSGLSDRDVRCLYRGASLLVFPSKYEGFGIPLLEAMASGIPVAASDISVFREILGDAGAYFDPDSASEMAGTIRAVLESPERRMQLVERGAARVGNFDFDVLAKDMMAVYQSLMDAD